MAEAPQPSLLAEAAHLAESLGKAAPEEPTAFAADFAAKITEQASTDPKSVLEGLASGIDVPEELQKEVGQVPAEGKFGDDMAKMNESDKSITQDEFDKTEVGQKELVTKTANECLSSATDSVRADILKDMAKDGEPVKLDADGWPVDRIQKVKLLDAMEKRQGEIEDNALKAAVAERLGPIPKDPQGERKWREDYKDGVDKALDAKKKLKDSNGAKTADAAGTAGAAPATGETALPAAASSKEAAATTPEATAEKKDSAEKQNTLGQAFKDATEYILAPNKQKNEKAGTRSKEVIMEEVKKFDATEEGKGYLKKFIFAQISLTAILGIALESADNLNQKAQAEMQRSKQVGGSASA